MSILKDTSRVPQIPEIDGINPHPHPSIIKVINQTVPNLNLAPVINGSIIPSEASDIHVEIPQELESLREIASDIIASFNARLNLQHQFPSTDDITGTVESRVNLLDRIRSLAQFGPEGLAPNATINYDGQVKVDANSSYLAINIKDGDNNEKASAHVYTSADGEQFILLATQTNGYPPKGILFKIAPDKTVQLVAISPTYVNNDHPFPLRVLKLVANELATSHEGKKQAAIAILEHHSLPHANISALFNALHVLRAKDSQLADLIIHTTDLTELNQIAFGSEALIFAMMQPSRLTADVHTVPGTQLKAEENYTIGNIGFQAVPENHAKGSITLQKDGTNVCALLPKELWAQLRPYDSNGLAYMFTGLKEEADSRILLAMLQGLTTYYSRNPLTAESLFGKILKDILQISSNQ